MRVVLILVALLDFALAALDAIVFGGTGGVVFGLLLSACGGYLLGRAVSLDD